MKNKILILAILSTLLLGHSTYAGISPKYLFNLGMTIDEFQKDSRYSKCSLKGYHLLSSDVEDKKTKAKYTCLNLSGAKEASLMFFNHKLIGMSVDFNLPTREEFFTYIVDPNNKSYIEKYLTTYNSLMNFCQSIGKLQGKKLENEGTKLPNGLYFVNIATQFLSNDGKNCIVYYQGSELWNKDKKKNDQWYLPQSVIISDIIQIKKATNQ